MRETIKRWGLLILVSGAVLAIDQLIKQRVTATLAYGQSWTPIPSIAAIARVTRSQNTGAAFGMFPFASDFFLVLALITIAAFIVSYPRLPSHAGLSRLSIALISGGALSNAIDRLLLGHVVDYVHIQLSPTLSNISNLADHAITVGVALLLIDQWRAERREQAAAAAQQSGLNQDNSQMNPAADDDAAGSPESTSATVDRHSIP